MVEVRFGRGIYLPGPDLWLDPRGRAGRAFVSHAHSDHIGRHAWTLCTPCTSRLMAARSSSGAEVAEVLFGEEVDLGGGWRAELIPAGHVTGSAQIFVEGPEGTLLYTGDFKRRPSPSCEPHELRQAETYITECTYGLPRYIFPPAEETSRQIAEFCADCAEAGEVAVLLAYSLGKAQELACIAAAAGLRVVAHPSVVKMASICAEFLSGIPVPGPLEPENCSGAAVIVPPGSAGARAAAQIKGARLAAVTGWALESGGGYHPGTDAVFPLSDHAGYDDLIRTAEEVAPKRIYTVHGFAREFAADLRGRGFDARALGLTEQLDFGGFSEISPVTLPSRPDIGTPPNSLGSLAETAGKIAGAAARARKLAILAEYLAGLDPADRRRAPALLAAGTGGKKPGLGPAILRIALAPATGLAESEIRSLQARLKDPGKVAAACLAASGNPIRFPSLAEAEEALCRLDAVSAPLPKAFALSAAIRGLAPEAGAFFVRVASGSLRIGLDATEIERVRSADETTGRK